MDDNLIPKKDFSYWFIMVIGLSLNFHRCLLLILLILVLLMKTGTMINLHVSCLCLKNDPVFAASMFCTLFAVCVTSTHPYQ